MFGLKIVIADPDDGQRINIKEILTQAGAIIVGEAEEGRKAARLIFELQPDLAVLDTNLPLRSGLEIARIVDEQRGCPIILITSNFTGDLLERAKEYGVYGLVLKPEISINLVIIAELAISLHSRRLHIEQERNKLADDLESRKLIEKAKGLLMLAKDVKEEEAYQMMRKLSQDKSKSMKQIAKEVIKILGHKYG